MKIYIYRQFLSPDFLNWYEQLYAARAFSLNHHYDWFKDILATLSAFETDDPDQADYFFIPIYVLPFQFLNADIGQYIGQCRYLDRGRHIMFASGDFGQRAKSEHEGHHEGRAYKEIYSWLDERFVLIALESTRDLLPADVAIPPYQISFKPALSGSRLVEAPPGSCEEDVDLRAHRLLYAFCGALSYAQLKPDHVRGSQGLIRHNGHGQDWFIGTPEQAAATYGPVWGVNRQMIARATFTLCPAGFGRWSFRWIEALLHGSIPVILSDGYLLPFSQYIDWEKYIVTLLESCLHDIDATLRAIPVGRVFELQNNIYRDRQLFTREHCLKLLGTRLADLQARHRAQAVAAEPADAAI
jgi:Exostosin family